MIIKNQMAQSLDRINNNSSVRNQTANKVTSTSGQSFQNILQESISSSDELTFSKHANSRLETRNITIDENQMERLVNGLQSAKSKGIKESLMLMDDVALVVNVENSTVITALDKDETRAHVFTNIDGAVIL